MVLKRIVAIVNFLVAVDIAELQVTGFPNLSFLVEVLQPALVSMVGNIVSVLEEAFDVEAPDFAELFALIVTRAGVGASRIFRNLTLGIPQSSLHMVVERMAGKLEVVSPADAQLPTVGLHVGVVALRRVVAIDSGEFRTDDIHVARVFAIDIKREVEAVFEHVDIQAEVVGDYLLPSQTGRNR